MEKTKKARIPVKTLCFCALFAAMTGICAQISLPMWPANICLSLFAVELCGALMKKQYALLSMGVYILAGLMGVPMFSGFKAGPSVLFGTTGGYILGYAVCAFLIALIIEKVGREWWKQAIAMVCGLLVCYAFGTAWFMILTGRSLAESLTLCVVPFLPGDAVKIILAVILSVRLYVPMKKIMA